MEAPLGNSYMAPAPQAAIAYECAT
jgi:hypothetical protein